MYHEAICTETKIYLIVAVTQLYAKLLYSRLSFFT